MVPEIIRYTIPLDQKDAFEADYHHAFQILERNPHCLGWQFRVSTNSPSNYLIEIDWDSESGHREGFHQSPDFPPFLKLVSPYFDHIQEMSYYHPCSEQI